ncbi:SMP-30/gluconolactonase/LRE family protein [Streptomyces sp. NPDC057939]|uniref:SMP-30/gluconolactonase/LRE family protein n=1 Tax=Streptomyces sp. NPDC057939 TaxID=3346284 RepID=UPI0036E1E82F
MWSKFMPVPLALAAALSLGAAPAPSGTSGASGASGFDVRVTTAFELPGTKVYPEGIAADARTGTVYVGSYADGTVYRARPGARRAEVFLPAGADGRTTANGLRVDARGRLWVTDSTKGVTVYDTRTGARLARFDVPGDAPRFVNDLTVTPDGSAYLTDSVRGVIYRVTPDQPASGDGPLSVAYDLTPALRPRPAGGFSLNGIVSDPAGRWLLTVDMPEGELLRVDLRTGAVGRVALTGGNLTSPDGLDLSPDGTLRVAQNVPNTLTRWKLSADGTRGRLTGTLTDPSLQIPTTLTHRPGRTLVVRSQFDKDGPLTPSTGAPTTFTIASVRGF